jgi:hypothetical protein
MSRDSRAYVLDLNDPYQVGGTAISVLARFTDELFEFIEEDLIKSFGLNWQLKFALQRELEPNLNFSDPLVLLKEIGRNGQSKLRAPLNKKLNSRSDLAKFYNGISNLIGDRNAWVHRQVKESQQELLSLLLDIKELGEPFEFKICEVVDSIQAQIGVTNTLPLMKDNSEQPIGVENLPPTLVSNGKAREELIASSELFGSVVVDQFLSHTYIVVENCDLLDRPSGQLLSETHPDTYLHLTAKMSGIRVGSRLRITEEGVLAAFFNDRWSYLAQVKQDEWFINHLH